MRKRINRDVTAPISKAGEPEDFGWRRRVELDEGSREAWQLRTGAIMLLDPTGLNDAVIRSEPVIDENGDGSRARIAGLRGTGILRGRTATTA